MLLHVHARTRTAACLRPGRPYLTRETSMERGDGMGEPVSALGMSPASSAMMRRSGPAAHAARRSLAMAVSSAPSGYSCRTRGTCHAAGRPLLPGKGDGTPPDIVRERERYRYDSCASCPCASVVARYLYIIPIEGGYHVPMCMGVGVPQPPSPPPLSGARPLPPRRHVESAPTLL